MSKDTPGLSDEFNTELKAALRRAATVRVLAVNPNVSQDRINQMISDVSKYFNFTDVTALKSSCNRLSLEHKNGVTAESKSVYDAAKAMLEVIDYHEKNLAARASAAEAVQEPRRQAEQAAAAPSKQQPVPADQPVPSIQSLRKQIEEKKSLLHVINRNIQNTPFSLSKDKKLRAQEVKDQRLQFSEFRERLKMESDKLSLLQAEHDRLLMSMNTTPELGQQAYPGFAGNSAPASEWERPPRRCKTRWLGCKNKPGYV